MAGGIVIPGDYDDWRWGGTGVNPPGAPAAAVLTQVNPNEWHWVFTNNSTMVFTDKQIPHEYKEGTDMQPHIHWTPTSTGTYTGTWTLYITSWLSVATGSARQSLQTVTASFNSSMTAGQVQTANFSAVMPGTGRKISSIATFTLVLSLSSGAGCALLGLDGHYIKDRLGSKQITAK